MKRRALIIDGYHTALDGHMTLSAFVVETPKHQEITQKVPGMDGVLDFSDAVSGRPTYSTRKLTASLESSYGRHIDRQQIFDDFVNRVTGRRCRIITPDHPDRYLIGRVQADFKFNRPTYGQIDIEAVCEPWYYASAPCVASVPILGRPADLLTTAGITYIADSSTCDNAWFARSTANVAGNFTMQGSVRSTAIWCIDLTPNKDYYVAARIRDGRGAWGCAATVSADTWTRGAVRTGADGYLYFKVENYSTTNVVVTPVIVLPAESVCTAQNGVAPAVATVNFAAISATIAAKSIVVCTDHNAIVLQSKGAWEVDVPPGDVPLIAYTWQAETVGQCLPISWIRGDILA